MEITENSQGDRKLIVRKALVDLAKRVFKVDADSNIMRLLCKISADELVRLERLAIEDEALAEWRLRQAFAHIAKNAQPIMNHGDSFRSSMASPEPMLLHQCGSRIDVTSAKVLPLLLEKR